VSAVRMQLVAAAVAACICALGLGIYDQTVRQPRTPRLAIIDIAKIYASADQSFKARALDGQFGGPAAGAAPGGPGPAGLRNASEFGPMLHQVLLGLSTECRCAIVAMATVVGDDSTVPDFTAEVARRMGLTLREAAP
jgi:hypothetical protein